MAELDGSIAGFVSWVLGTRPDGTTGLASSHAPARRAYEKAGFANSIPMVTYRQKL